MSVSIYEFETVCDSARVTEFWRVEIADTENLTDAEVHDRLVEELDKGSCELLNEETSWEEDRVVEPSSIIRSELCDVDDADAPYTVIGIYTDSEDPDGEPQRFVKVYHVGGGPWAAEALARAAQPTLVIAGVVEGAVAMADAI